LRTGLGLCDRVRSTEVKVSDIGRVGYPLAHSPTNDSAGGKLPMGKTAVRSPAFSFSAASRKGGDEGVVACPEIVPDAPGRGKEERRG
jgi:hypothetical protein